MRIIDIHLEIPEDVLDIGETIEHTTNAIVNGDLAIDELRQLEADDRVVIKITAYDK